MSLRKRPLQNWFHSRICKCRWCSEKRLNTRLPRCPHRCRIRTFHLIYQTPVNVQHGSCRRRGSRPFMCYDNMIPSSVSEFEEFESDRGTKGCLKDDFMGVL